MHKQNPPLNAYKKYFIIIGKLLISYLLLYGVFRAYVGITDPNGSWHSPFLQRYSLLQLLLDSLIYPAKTFLEIMGFSTRHTADSIGISGGNGVHIAYPCMGVENMIAFTSLLYAFPGKRKIVFWLAGIIGIHVLNICRILTIILFNKSYPDVVDTTHTFFNLFSYVLILALFYSWYRRYSRDTF